MNESSVGNVHFRNISEEKRVVLKIGGVGLTLQQSTGNSLTRLANEVGEIHPDNNELESEASSNDVEMADAATNTENTESTAV